MVITNLLFQAVKVGELAAETGAALVHDLGRLAKVLLADVEAVEKVVVVVDRQVGRPGPDVQIRSIKIRT